MSMGGVQGGEPDWVMVRSLSRERNWLGGHSESPNGAVRAEEEDM
jgi:hypothetical protein